MEYTSGRASHCKGFKAWTNAFRAGLQHRSSKYDWILHVGHQKNKIKLYARPGCQSSMLDAMQKVIANHTSYDAPACWTFPRKKKHLFLIRTDITKKKHLKKNCRAAAKKQPLGVNLEMGGFVKAMQKRGGKQLHDKVVHLLKTTTKKSLSGGSCIFFQLQEEDPGLLEHAKKTARVCWWMFNQMFIVFCKKRAQTVVSYQRGFSQTV